MTASSYHESMTPGGVVDGKVQSVFDDRGGASSACPQRVHPDSGQPVTRPTHPPFVMHRVEDAGQFMEAVRKVNLADLKSQREIFST